MAQEYTADTVKELVRLGAYDGSVINNEDGSKSIVVPNEAKLLNISPPEAKLFRVRQNVTLHDKASFVAYVNEHKTGATRIFAEPGFLNSNNEGVVQAVIDYHKAADGNPSTPDYGAHVATYRPRYSDQWKAWEAACDRTLKQAEFAEFIEENRKDIVEPSAASLMDTVRTFKASKKVEFDTLTYTNDGSALLHYSEDVQQHQKAGGQTRMPEKLKLGIPVYFRGILYEVEVFVRFRVLPGSVVFDLKMDRADVIEDAAFTELVADIEQDAATQTFLGHRG